MRRVLRGVTCGLVAAIVALGVAELVASASSALRSPIIDVGNRVVDLAPPFVKDLAIRWFASDDKKALLIGIAVLLTLYAGAAGVLALRHLRLGVAAIGAFGLVGTWAALTGREQRGPIAVLPSLAGAAAGAIALVLVVRAASAANEAKPHGAKPPEPLVTPAQGSSRRAFLVLGGGLAVAGLAGGAAGRWLGERFSAMASRASVVLPRARTPLPPVPASVEIGVPGVTPFVTPNATSTASTPRSPVPQVPVDGWRLRITGMVDHPLKLTFDDLLGRDADRGRHHALLRVQRGRRRPRRQRPLARRAASPTCCARPACRPRADQVVGRSVDGFTAGFPVGGARRAATRWSPSGMNGEPLPLEHGFPARLVVPGLYGYVSATKWLQRDRAHHASTPSTPTGCRRGWAQQAPIKTSSRIDAPRGWRRLRAGPVAVAGVAWAQTGASQASRSRSTDGAWQPARLAAALQRRHVAAVGHARGTPPPASTRSRPRHRRNGSNPDRAALRTQTERVERPAPDRGARQHLIHPTPGRRKTPARPQRHRVVDTTKQRSHHMSPTSIRFQPVAWPASPSASLLRRPRRLWQQHQQRFQREHRGTCDDSQPARTASTSASSATTMAGSAEAAIARPARAARPCPRAAPAASVAWPHDPAATAASNNPVLSTLSPLSPKAGLGRHPQRGRALHHLRPGQRRLREDPGRDAHGRAGRQDQAHRHPHVPRDRRPEAVVHAARGHGPGHDRRGEGV